MALRLAFMGTPDFAVPALSALVAAGHDIAAVYCQPPRPAGRGQRVTASPVQRRAEARKLTVRSPTQLKSPEVQSAFTALNVDAAVVVAYGLLLPPALLAAPRLGCINIHASLLPRWRGAAPIQHAILAGDTETGVTIMQMDEGLDTGPILLTEKVPLTAVSTAQTLHDTLGTIGARLVVRALDGLEAGSLTATPQPETGVSYADKLTKDDGLIEWRKPAAALHRQIRALTPWPGCWFPAGKEVIKIAEATVVDNPNRSAPGTLLDNGFTIACGDGALRLVQAQRAGRAWMSGSELLRGLNLTLGRIVGGTVSL